MAKRAKVNSDAALPQVVANGGALERIPESIGILEVVRDAINGGAGIEVIERLLAVHERWEANQARKSFEAAMSLLRGDLPRIAKTLKVDFESRRVEGSRTNYNYEDLGEMGELLNPELAKHGLSFRWRIKGQTANSLTVSCVVSHRDGHFEETELTGPFDMSGNKNQLQGIGSTTKYLGRYTLKLALGIASSEDDDDGEGAGGCRQEDGGQGNQEKQSYRPPTPRTTKHPHCQAHTDLGEAIKRYCAERPGTEPSKILEETTTTIAGNAVQPGVKDVLLLSEDEAKAALGRLKAFSASRPATGVDTTGRNYAKELGLAVVAYVKAHKEDFKNKETGECGDAEISAGNYLVLEDVTGLTNLAKGDRAKLFTETITPDIAKRALEKFEREYKQ